MSRPLFDDSFLIRDLTTCARIHGDSGDADHEVGDLQDMLTEAWSIMTTQQRMSMLSSPCVATVVENATGTALLTEQDELDHEEWLQVCEHYGLDDSFQYTHEQQIDAANHLRLERIMEELGETSAVFRPEPQPAKAVSPRRARP